MKSRRRLIPKPKLKVVNILEKLIKTKIDYDDFLSYLDEASDTFFDNPELEFELLLSNGLPIDIDSENMVYLKTNETKIEDQVFCIVDIESNGSCVKKGAQIIELGAVKYKNGKIIDKFESLVFAKNIPEFIQEVTQITPLMLEDAPSLQNVLKEFKLFLDDDVFVAHNIKFDYGFISDSFEKYDLGKLENRKLCTIDLARRCIKSEKYGLRALKEALNINVENHHRAYYDALATVYIFEECIKNLTDDILTTEDLILFSKSSKTKQVKKNKEDIKNNV